MYVGGRSEGGYNGAARITWFVDFREELVKGWCVRLSIDEKGYIIFGYALDVTGSTDDAGEFIVEGLTGIR